MKEQIIGIIVNFVVTGLLGYFIATLKNFKKKKKDRDDLILKKLEVLEKRLDVVEQEDLKQMKSDLSNKFFVYNAMNEVEDYLVESYREDCERYFNRGGDSWIHSQYDKSFDWKIRFTGYIK